MVGFFEPGNPLKAVRAFYGVLFAWDDGSRVEISTNAPDRATLGGETITNLIPARREDFKAFVERHAVHVSRGEHYDDFFALFDRALDAVDPDFRRKNGIFFTDLSLSRFVLWMTKRELGDIGARYLVVDPACGSGNLVTNWRSPLALRHKVVSEIEPELLFAVERRMQGDAWHQGKLTVVPKVGEGRGLNFLDIGAAEYLDVLSSHLREKGHSPSRPIAFLCNPPYRSDDDQAADAVSYRVDPSIVEAVGNDAASERYCCFLAQMKLICDAAAGAGLPGESLMLVFTKTAWLTNRPIFRKTRGTVLGAFESLGGVIVNGKEFFDVAEFPVAFTLWRYAGKNVVLDTQRSVPLLDLTWLKRSDLERIQWDDESTYDAQCSLIVEDKAALRVAFGGDRPRMPAWVGQKMVDFKRDRRRSEQGARIAGGLPAGDARHANRKAYGEADGESIGFMDDVTPVRIKAAHSSVPWFRLNNQFMDCRKTRCYSGPPTHFGFCARDEASAEKLFLWFAVGRTFAAHGYPMWADALELWPPAIASNRKSEVLEIALAIGLAENECVETTYPANNPVDGAREVHVSNPMAPTDPQSFWSTRLGKRFRGGSSGAAAVVAAVAELYGEWDKEFRYAPQIMAPYQRPYFIGQGFLHRSSGLVQIKDFANEMGRSRLIAAHKHVTMAIKKLREAFHSMLLDPRGLDYFGDPRRGLAKTHSAPQEPTELPRHAAGSSLAGGT